MGYYQFNVCDKKLVKPKKYLQQWFVYEAIKGAIPDGCEINHKNEDKNDNRLKHLEIVTHQQNIEKSKNKSVFSIRLDTKEEKMFFSLKTAAIDLDICATLICAICRKKEKNEKPQNLKKIIRNTHLNLLNQKIYYLIF